MPSKIDPTHPVTGIAVSKAAERTNWATAKSEIDHGGFVTDPTTATEAQGTAALASINTKLDNARLPLVQSETAATVTVNEAYFGDRGMVVLRLNRATDITVTLEADVAVGKSVHMVQRNTGVPTGVAGAGATLTIPSGASASPGAQQGSVVFLKISATEWLVVDRGGA